MRFSTPFSPLPAVTGISLCLQGDGTWRADFCRLERRGDTVRVSQQGRGLGALPALLSALGPEPLPVALVLSGRGVLLRTLPGQDPDQAQPARDVLANVLPGVNLADFYLHYEPGPEVTHAALVRKAVVDALVTDFLAAGLWVVALQFGPYGLETLLPYLSESAKHTPQLVAGEFVVHLNAARERIAAVDHQPGAADTAPPFVLGDETVPAALGLPYAAALVALTRSAVDLSPHLPIPAVAALRAEWDQRRWFMGLRLAVPLVILVLLLVNFLASQHLLAEQDRLSVRAGSNQQVLAQLQALQRADRLRHSFLTSTGWGQPSWNSLCADRLAASMPAGLNLQLLEVSPRASTAGGTRPVLFENGRVLVRGQCRDAQRLNQWLQQITRLPWVEAVREQNFAYDYAGGEGTFTFTLVIRPADLLR